MGEEVIRSKEEYQALEGELKGLLAGLGSGSDLVDQHSIVPEARSAVDKIKEIKNKLRDYRSSHPEEFSNQ